MPENEKPPEHLDSINEPGSYDLTNTPVVEPPPALVLTSLDPAGIAVTADADFPLMVHGAGFDATCVIVFDDAELATVFGDATTLTAQPPMAASPGVVDVEVHRGEEMSDVVTFEFTALAGRHSRTPERKPRKAEPVHKRAKKGRR